MIPTKRHDPKPEHEVFRRDVLDFLNTRLGTLPAEEMLAVASYLVGQLTAHQDQRRFTSEMVMTIVSANIEAGNAHAIEALFGTTKGTA